MSDSFTGQQINASIIRLTAAQWAAQSYVLPVGVIGIESDTGASKVGDGRTAWADLAYWNPSGGPKVYRALLTQTGTDAPVATVLENTLGEVPTYAYTVLGEYALNLGASLFAANKTITLITPVGGLQNSPDVPFFNVLISSTTQIQIFSTITSSGGGGTWAAPVAADGLLSATYIQIIVYP